MSEQPIDALSVSVYSDGTDPIDWAVQLAATMLDVAQDVIEARTNGSPYQFPSWGEVTVDAVARRIVARLLDAGWTPPAQESINTAIEHQRTRDQEIAAQLRSGHTPEGLADVLEDSPDARDRIADACDRHATNATAYLILNQDDQSA